MSRALNRNRSAGNRNRIAGVVLAGAFACMPLLSAHAVEIYKWVDENGTTHYSNVKPGGVEVKVVPDGGVSVIPGTRIGPEAARAAERERANVRARSTAVQDQAEALAQARLQQRRDQLLQDCLRNNGVECAREVDTELRAEGMQEGRGVYRTVPPPAANAPTSAPTTSGSASNSGSALR